MISEVFLVNVALSIPPHSLSCALSSPHSLSSVLDFCSAGCIWQMGWVEPRWAAVVAHSAACSGAGRLALYREVAAPGALATRECGWPPQGAHQVREGQLCPC